MEKTKIWLVTGASKGLGLTLVKELLKQNYYVAATSRTVDTLIAEVGMHKNFLPLALDITNDTAVAQAIQEITARFGGMDIIVNNAGYSQTGTIEELTADEVKKNFEVNVHGSLNIVRHAAAHFRSQQSGHIFNISSIGGIAGNYPGFGVYCATKFAVAGFTEALAEEMKPFGVHTTIVYPGYFRTNFLSAGSIQTPKHPIAAYGKARASEEAHMKDIDGNQPNDPQKAAHLFIEVSKLEQPPVHLFMGKDAYEVAHQKIKILTEELTKWKELTTSTTY